MLNVVNPTAGFLDGDRLRSEVRVECGARLLLTTPSASRVHTMRGGRAEVSQRFRVAAGGSLEVWPELLIPQRGARYRQETRIDLERGGRVAVLSKRLPRAGWPPARFSLFDELRWATDVRLAGRLVARERYRLSPGDGSLDALAAAVSPCAYYASAFLVSPTLTARSANWDALLALHRRERLARDQRAGRTAFGVENRRRRQPHFRRTLHAARASSSTARWAGRPPGLRRAGEMSD